MADALDSKSSSRKAVWVRVPPPVPDRVVRRRRKASWAFMTTFQWCVKSAARGSAGAAVASGISGPAATASPNIRRRLATLRLSQNELARRLGWTSGTVSDTLNGRRGNCSLAVCDRIATALGTTTAELLNDPD